MSTSRDIYTLTRISKRKTYDKLDAKIHIGCVNTIASLLQNCTI